MNAFLRNCFSAVAMLLSISCASVGSGIQPEVLAGFYLPPLADEASQPVRWNDLRSIYEQEWPDSITVTPEDGDDTHVVERCSDAATLPSHTRTLELPDFDRWLSIRMMCHAVEAMLDAASSQQSFVRNFAFTRELPTLLPPELLLTTNSYGDELIAKASSWGDLFTATDFELESAESARYTSRESGDDQRLKLIARADFNHDGLEDLMISSSDSLLGGHYYNLRIFIITRDKQGGPFSLVREMTFWEK